MYWLPRETTVSSASYKGKKHDISFEYRDPWDWIARLLEDDSLGPQMMFNSVRKYYCEGAEEVTFRERVIDEPTATPPRVRLSTTRRRPLSALRPSSAFLAGRRNASGNGGGVLVGYMTEIPDLEDPSDRKTNETLAFAKFKMEVYQKVLAVIFSSLKSRSRAGEAIRCWDSLVGIFHPGIFICSRDGKEAAYFNVCRAALANYPCPKCLLVPKLVQTFVGRTVETMRAVVQKARRATTKAEKEDILKRHGLHDIKHFLWGFRFSNPYAANAYDTLHADDDGDFGHHLWLLTLDVLEEIETYYSLWIAVEFARWPGLKHFNQVTTVHFTDGQSYYDIEKLPPGNSALVHCIRAQLCLRMITGMDCMPVSRLERLKKFISDYEYWSS
ncbi:hypothetical protein C8R47DRAFT_1320312, partial [Mycena vitilis]